MKHRNLTLYISGGIAVLIALIILIVVYAVKGDLIAWFSSKWGGTFIIVVSVFIIIWFILFVREKVRKL